MRSAVAGDAASAGCEIKGHNNSAIVNTKKLTPISCWDCYNHRLTPHTPSPRHVARLLEGFQPPEHRALAESDVARPEADDDREFAEICFQISYATFFTLFDSPLFFVLTSF